MSADEALVMRRHREYWTPRVEIGVVIAMGPVADPAGGYGVAIIEAPSRNALEAMLAVGPGDPVEARIFLRSLFHARDRGAAEPAARPDRFRNSLIKRRAPDRREENGD